MQRCASRGRLSRPARTVISDRRREHRGPADPFRPILGRAHDSSRDPELWGRTIDVSDPVSDDEPQPRPTTTIEVFAEVGCPFTHVGLRRLVEHRRAARRDDVRFHVRAWPLELVNGAPLDAAFIAEEVDEIRPQVAPDLFSGFSAAAFPATSLPAMALESAAYEVGPVVGEKVSLDLRDRLFEQGDDIAEPSVLADIAAAHGISFDPDDLSAAQRDHTEGVERGVIGSPHFFTPSGSFFCPALDVSRNAEGHLVVTADPDGFDSFIAACFS